MTSLKYQKKRYNKCTTKYNVIAETYYLPMDIKLTTGHIWSIADREPMNPESNPDLRKEERILKEAGNIVANLSTSPNESNIPQQVEEILDLSPFPSTPFESSEILYEVGLRKIAEVLRPDIKSNREKTIYANTLNSKEIQKGLLCAIKNLNVRQQTVLLNRLYMERPSLRQCIDNIRIKM